ncbi:hypothetical protein PIB30_085207 [Stylosanthes scabra]|uniref:Secreted protein n=1 Tax=Stylosanthes scabra TaxID=79078 RepID=A0ABU6RSZ8_9FABA|nr:hypothetical protein [Stylosanthes scabra]
MASISVIIFVAEARFAAAPSVPARTSVVAAQFHSQQASPSLPASTWGVVVAVLDERMMHFNYFFCRPTFVILC